MVLNLNQGRRYYPATAKADGLLAAEDYALLHQFGSDSGWIDVGSFGANWGQYDTTTYRPQYRKLASGLVVFQGMVKKSAALALPETMFTLPAGYRPAKAGPMAAASAAGYAGVQVYTTGQLNLEVGGSATWVALADLVFYAEL